MNIQSFSVDALFENISTTIDDLHNDREKLKVRYELTVASKLELMQQLSIRVSAIASGSEKATSETTEFSWTTGNASANYTNSPPGETGDVCKLQVEVAALDELKPFLDELLQNSVEEEKTLQRNCNTSVEENRGNREAKAAAFEVFSSVDDVMRSCFQVQDMFTLGFNNNEATLFESYIEEDNFVDDDASLSAYQLKEQLEKLNHEEFCTVQQLFSEAKLALCGLSRELRQVLHAAGALRQMAPILHAWHNHALYRQHVVLTEKMKTLQYSADSCFIDNEVNEKTNDSCRADRDGTSMQYGERKDINGDCITARHSVITAECLLEGSQSDNFLLDQRNVNNYSSSNHQRMDLKKAEEYFKTAKQHLVIQVEKRLQDDSARCAAMDQHHKTLMQDVSELEEKCAALMKCAMEVGGLGQEQR